MSFFDCLQKEKRNERQIARLIFGSVLGACSLFFSCFEGRELFDFGFWWGRWWLFEVKSDYYVGVTSKKVFLETGNARTKAASGLTATIADRILLHCPALKTIYSFPPVEMHHFLKAECEDCDFIAKAGDGNSAGYLVNVAKLASLPFTKIIPYDT